MTDSRRKKVPSAKSIKNPDSIRLIAHGDIHGHLNKFQEDLHHAKLIDENNQWIGGNNILVQLGDVIDRGPQSEDALVFLSDLQIQADTHGGKVVRLFGNHEMMILEGDYRYTSPSDNVSNIAKRIRQDVKDEKIVLCYAYGDRMFIHGGIRSKSREQIKQEIQQDKGISIKSITIKNIADQMNELLINAVKKNDFSHPILHHEDGVLWTRMEALMASEEASQIKQIVGHSINPEGEYSPSLGRIDIDFGLCLGNLGFLEIKNDVLKMFRKSNSGQWKVTTLPNLAWEIKAVPKNWTGQ